ncbi:MAG: hypothetical protein KAR40_07875 [Candidatus Sabulitectum sp.]|nr:hypothetical protein [Candidatus Sabulitectum sp.]
MAECTLLPGATIYPRADLVPCFGYTEWRKDVHDQDNWDKETSGAEGWVKATVPDDGWTKE